MAYAVTTSVSVAKSKAQIEDIVSRYGASEFVSGWDGNRARIGFEMKGRKVRFVLTLPEKNARRFTPGKRGMRTTEAAEREWEQACRSLWRSLLLSIKAKLEAVASGIAVFDSEFLSHVVQSNGMTIGESLLPMLTEILAGTGPALPGPGESVSQ
jgi:hypothetical protein